MPAHRGLAKRVARQKAKRSARKKDLTQAESLRSPQALLKHAHEFPVDTTWLSNAWRWADEPIPSLVTAVMTRRRGTTILLGMALLDRTCLGLKDGIARVTTEDELDFILRQWSETNGPLEVVDLDTFLSVVYHSVEFAQSLGFAPRSPACLSFFGPRPATLLDTPLAHPQRPVYVSGPYDDPAHVVAKLMQARGTEFDAVDGFYEEPLFVVDPTLRQQAETLLEGAAGFQGADDRKGTGGPRGDTEGSG